ncbi:iron chelate uptake ABC transporter family permease subunit, partial [Streptomyces albidoflavus]
MRRLPTPWLWLLAVLLPCAVAALSLGTPYVPPYRLPQVLGGDGLAALVVGELRLPRLVLALVAGACLGAAGLVLQEAL